MHKNITEISPLVHHGFMKEQLVVYNGKKFSRKFSVI